MSETEAVVERFYEAFQPGNAAALRNAVSAEWIDHTLPPGRAPGLAGMEQALHQLHAVLPDLKTTLVKTVAQGDHVAVHIVFEGTHLGEFLGRSATHAAVRFIAFNLHRVIGQKIVESWHLEDNLSFLTQLGILPALA